MRLFTLLIAALVAAFGAFAAASRQFQDPLDAAAQPTRFVSTSHLGAIARAGERLVSVGVRGLIVVSDDAGQSWRQVASPVSSDLVSVRFISPKQGWAGGHDGVILSTLDGGQNWSLQLDGRMAAKLLVEHFSRLAAAGNAEAVRLQKEVERNYANGPEMPVLDLWFENERSGWAVGPFGTLLGTRDGGKTWQSWIEKVDNKKVLHFNAVRGIGGDIYLASEQGTVFRLDRASDRFLPLSTGYQGSFFGLVGTADYVIAYGLRGSAFRSRDRGKSWERLSTGVSGGITGASLLGDGRLLFVSQDGRLVMSSDQGSSFQSLPLERHGLFTDVAPATNDRAVLTGLFGIQRAVIPQ